MEPTTYKIGESVVLTTIGRKFIAKITHIFADGYGLRLNFCPELWPTVEDEGVLYGATFAFDHELSEFKSKNFKK